MRKPALLVAIMLLLLAAAASVASARSSQETEFTVADVIASDPSFSTLVSLTTTAGFADKLANPKVYLTLFAPGNAAFRRLERAVPGIGKALAEKKNRKILVELVKYHLSRQHLNAATLREIGSKKGTIGTLLGGTANGKLTVGSRPSAFTLTDSAKLGIALSTEFDIAADNGAVHVVNNVLLPRSVAAALVKAGLMDPCRAPLKYRGDKGETYTSYCGVCKDTGWRQIRADYEIASTNPSAIAFEYAAYDHKGSILPPAVDGCRLGFALRKKP